MQVWWLPRAKTRRGTPHAPRLRDSGRAMVAPERQRLAAHHASARRGAPCL